MNLDESSAEEDSRRRMLVKLKNSRMHSSVADHTKQPHLDSIATTKAVCENDTPLIRTIRELLEENNYMSKSDCAIIENKRSHNSNGSEQNSRTHLIQTSGCDTKEEHERLINTNPYQVAEFIQKRDQLPVSKFFCEDSTSSGLSQEELDKQLRESRLMLHCLSAEYESMFLAEGGQHCDQDGISRKFPVCCQDDQCVGMTIKFHHLTEKIKFVSLMFPNEYETFLQTGATPAVRRPCIPCCRYLLVDWEITCRSVQLLV
jgi:hypothetical protein